MVFLARGRYLLIVACTRMLQAGAMINGCFLFKEVIIRILKKSLLLIGK